MGARRLSSGMIPAVMGSDFTMINLPVGFSTEIDLIFFSFDETSAAFFRMIPLLTGVVSISTMPGFNLWDPLIRE